MTPREHHGPAAALTFLVSPDGVATPSGVLELEPMDEQSSPRPLPRNEGSGAGRHVDRARNGVEATHDRSDEIAVSFSDRGGETANASDVAALAGIARRLAAAAFLSRLAAGKTVVKDKAASPPNLMAVSGGTTAIDAFAHIAQACLEQISDNAELLQRSGDAEALHQTRVGVRRLRAALSAFRQILPPDALARWKGEAKWLAGELDTARELDTFIDLAADSTDAQGTGVPFLAALGERLVLARTAAYGDAVEALGSQRFAALPIDFAEWLDAPQWPRDGHAKSVRHGQCDASIVAARALKRMHRQLRKAGKHLDRLDPTERHQVRIKAKRLRYAAEFFGKTFGKSAHKRHEKLVTSLDALLAALGELNDIASAAPCARAVAGRSADLAFCAGEIVGRSRGRELRLLTGAVNAYRQSFRVAPFWS